MVKIKDQLYHFEVENWLIIIFLKDQEYKVENYFSIIISKTETLDEEVKLESNIDLKIYERKKRKEEDYTPFKDDSSYIIVNEKETYI